MYEQDLRKLLENNISVYQIEKKIKSLDNFTKEQLLRNKKFVQEELKLDEIFIANCIDELEDEKIKLEMISLYELSDLFIVDIIRKFSDETKKTILITNKHNFGEITLQSIITSLKNVSVLKELFKEHKEVFEKNNIKPYEITQNLTREGQIELINELDNMGFNLVEKKEIIATLKDETKNEVDKCKIPQQCLNALEIQLDNEGKDEEHCIIKVDFNKDLEIYRFLDRIIVINPTEALDEDREKILKLCEICPEMTINDYLTFHSNPAKYKEAEIWIQAILEAINPEWSEIEKVAFIDNAIGKKLSYSPDYHTEVRKIAKTRALWEIICSGYGVCNGIAQVEKYMLNKVGIDADIVGSKEHGFLRLKNIEIPTKEGGVVKGDTIIDPTWNLPNHRFGAKPDSFCRSYGKIREQDITCEGEDTEAHKNEDLASATVDLDEQCLRQIYTSIGIADEKGEFPIGKFLDEAKIIDESGFSEEENLRRQLLLITKYCPEFAICQNSTLWALKVISLNQQNLKFNKCVANVVYERDDETKNPVLYVYADLPKAGKKFYFGDKEKGEFVELSQEEFERKFECYKIDFIEQEGHRP